MIGCSQQQCREEGVPQRCAGAESESVERNGRSVEKCSGDGEAVIEKVVMGRVVIKLAMGRLSWTLDRWILAV
jgi:hypothetical protein